MKQCLFYFHTCLLCAAMFPKHGSFCTFGAGLFVFYSLLNMYFIFKMWCLRSGNFFLFSCSVFVAVVRLRLQPGNGPFRTLICPFDNKFCFRWSAPLFIFFGTRWTFGFSHALIDVVLFALLVARSVKSTSATGVWLVVGGVEGRGQCSQGTGTGEKV